MKKIFHILVFCCFYFISTNTICQNTYADIIPILHEKCATCHRDGGGAPFSVLNFDEVYSNLADDLFILIFFVEPSAQLHDFTSVA